MIESVYSGKAVVPLYAGEIMARHNGEDTSCSGLLELDMQLPTKTCF